MTKAEFYQTLIKDETDEERKRLISSIFDLTCEFMESQEKEQLSEEELEQLQVFSLADDIENGTMAKDLGSFYPHDDQSWIQGYAVGFNKGCIKGYEKGKKIKLI